MEKVICIICKTKGYTASPYYTHCECGGRLKMMTKRPIDKERLSLKMIRSLHESSTYIQ